MKVLITGGTGTISSGLVQECVNRGYETYAITRGSNNERNVNGANYIYTNIWNTDEVRAVFDGLNFDVIVECLVYTTEQLEISLNNFADKCKQYIFISTAAIYDRKGNQRVKESDKKDFVKWDYTKNKIECENYLKKFCQAMGLNYTIVRPTVTYGDYRIPFPIATRNPGWTFFQRMLDGKPMMAGDNVPFSIIHIEDFSRNVVSLFENCKAINEEFHITSINNEIYWDDVIIEAGKILGVVPKIVHVPINIIKKIWPGIYEEINYHKNTTQVFDDTKLKSVTGIDDTISLEEGMKKTIYSMQTEAIKDNLDLDNKWEDYCNASIYYAYKTKQLSPEDGKIVDEYISVAGNSMFENSIKKAKMYAVKDFLYWTIIKIKRKIKKLVH